METVAHATNVQDLLVDVPVARAQPEVRRRPMFTGLEDHSISFEDAQALIRNYGETAGLNAIKGGFFGQASLQQLLDQEGVVGLRYYYGREKNGRQVLVLVGVDAFGQDLVDGFWMEKSIACPPFCGW